MTTPTLKQWQRRALAAETEVVLVRQMRRDEGVRQLEMARELAACKVALREARDAIDWALGEAA